MTWHSLLFVFLRAELLLSAGIDGVKHHHKPSVTIDLNSLDELNSCFQLTVTDEGEKHWRDDDRLQSLAASVPEEEECTALTF